MFILSANPTVQQQQLQELVRISEQKLYELTQPVSLFYPWEVIAYDKLTSYEQHTGYRPPTTRFAKLSNYKPSLDWNG